jgi:hypothetical protein
MLAICKKSEMLYILQPTSFAILLLLLLLLEQYKKMLQFNEFIDQMFKHTWCYLGFAV